MLMAASRNLMDRLFFIHRGRKLMRYGWLGSRSANSRKVGKLVKHRKFNADRFLDKFEGHEVLLRNYCRRWAKGLKLDLRGLTISGFKQWLANAAPASDAFDQLMEGLYRCYDLATELGHEQLVGACRTHDYEPDPDADLPVECLALKILTEQEDAFNLAYDRHAMFHAQRFSIYQIEAPRRLRLLGPNIARFRKLLADKFVRDKQSERVLVRRYREESSVNLIVYHEKRAKATLVFKNTKKRPKVGPTIFRPAQQDFLRYDESTGQLEIEAAFEREEETLRRAFGQAFFSDAELFEGAAAADCLDLGALAEPDFSLDTPEDINAALVDLRFGLNEQDASVWSVRSKDMLHTLESHGLRSKLAPDSIRSAVIRINFPDDRRGKRVELSGCNKVKFNRATHADDVFALLKEWGLLKADDEDEEPEAGHAVATRAGAAARNGQAAVAVRRNRTVPATVAARPHRKKKPR